jgi:hypothetical protein
MSEYKIEILVPDPKERERLITSFGDAEVYEQTNFDGKRFVELWLEPASKGLKKIKKTLLDFIIGRKIEEIKVTKSDGSEVLVKSVYPDDLDKVDEFVESIFSKIK